MKSPEFSSRTHFSAGTIFPFIQITTDPGLQTDVAPTASPTLNDASANPDKKGTAYLTSIASEETAPPTTSARVVAK